MNTKFIIKTSLEFAEKNIDSADKALVEMIKEGVIYVNGDAEEIDTIINDMSNKIKHFKERHLQIRELSKVRKQMVDAENID